MKNVLVAVVLSLISVNAFAANYACKGIDRADNNREVSIGLTSVSASSLVLADETGHDVELTREERHHEEMYQLASYAERNIDAYGTFTKVSFPKKIADGTAEEAFAVYYLKKVFAEEGRVSKIDIKAICK